MAYDIGPKIGMDGEAEFRKQLNNINAELRTLGSELKKVASGFKNNAQGQDALIAKNKTLQKSVDAEKRKIEEANKALEAAKKNYGENSTEALKWQNVINRAETTLNELEAEIEENDQALEEMEKGLRDAATGAKIMVDAVGSGNAKLGEFSAKAGELGNKMSAAGKSLKWVSAGFAATGFAIGKSAVDFESAFAGVEKTVEGTDKQLANIRQGMLGLSKSTSSSASDIAAVAEAAGQLGIKTPNIMKFTETMVKLGDTTNLSAEEAASALAKFANITGTSANDYDRLGSVIVDLGNNFATTESDIVSMSTRLASSGTLAGLTEPQIMALGTAMSSVGIEAEAGGTAMSKLIKQMQVSVETGSGQLEQFASVAGMTGKQFKAAFEEDAVGALGAFISGLNDTERNGVSAIAVLEDMGIKEARLSDTILRLSSSGDLLTNALDTANGAWKDNNALNKEAQKRYETTAAKLSQAKAALTELGISLGDTLLPAIKSGAEGLKKFSDKLSKAGPVTKTLTLGIIGIGAAAGPALSAIGKVSTGVSALTGWMSKASNAEKLAAVSSSKLGAASTGLFKILTKNPYAMVGVAAAGMATAIYKGIKSIHAETNAAREAAAEREKAISGVRAQNHETDIYFQKLQELSGVENKTIAQKQLMQSYVDKLNESVEGLNLTYDEENDKLSQSVSAIEKKIEAQKQEAMQAAYLKQSKKAMEDLVETEIKLADKEAERAQKQKEYEAIFEKGSSITYEEARRKGELDEEIKALSKDIKGLTNAQSNYNQEYVKLSNLAAMQGEAWKTLAADAKTAGYTIPESLITGIQEGTYAIPETMDELTALIDFQNAVDNAGAGGSALVEELTAKIAEGEISVADATKELTDANAAQLEKGASGASEKGKKTGENYAGGISVTKVDSSTAGTTVASSAQAAMASVSFFSTGKNAGIGYANGIRNAIGQAALAARTIAEQALAAAKKQSEVQSPSKRWERELGMMDGAGLAEGLRKSIPEVRKAGAALSEAAFPGYTGVPVNVVSEMERVAAVAQTSFTAEFDYERLAKMMSQGIYLEGRQMGRAMRAAGVTIT